MSPPYSSIALHYSKSKRNLVNNFTGFVSLELPRPRLGLLHKMSCIHLPDHIGTILTFLYSNSYVALVLKVLGVRVYTITVAQSHAPVQSIVLKCPEWAERSTHEVHKKGVN